MFNDNVFNSKALVIDMGTANTKFGWSGDEEPSQVVRSILGKVKYNKVLRD